MLIVAVSHDWIWNLTNTLSEFDALYWIDLEGVKLVDMPVDGYVGSDDDDVWTRRKAMFLCALCELLGVRVEILSKFSFVKLPVIAIFWECVVYFFG